MDLLQREHLKSLAGIGVAYIAFAIVLLISLALTSAFTHCSDKYNMIMWNVNNDS